MLQTASYVLSYLQVYFGDLSDEEIEAYIATKEPMDKAGSYGIQEKLCWDSSLHLGLRWLELSIELEFCAGIGVVFCEENWWLLL